MKLIIMVGLPGSGKSTIASKLANENRVHLEADEIRLNELRAGYSKQDNAAVFREMEARTVAALNSGKDVLFDATNLRRYFRENTLRNILNKCPDAFAEAIVVDVPLEECLRRNAKREGARCVPEEAIVRMCKSFELPTFKEGFLSITRVNL